MGLKLGDVGDNGCFDCSDTCMVGREGTGYGAKLPDW